MRMVVFEDGGDPLLGPLAQTRPVFDLRCGALSLLERQQRCLGADEVFLYVRPEMAELTRFLHPGVPVNQALPHSTDELVIVNARWLAPPALPPGWRPPLAGCVGDEMAFVALPGYPVPELPGPGLPWLHKGWHQALPTLPAGGTLMRHPWDLVEHNAAALRDDGRFWRTHQPTAPPGGYSLIGAPDDLLVDPTARIEPLVLIDTTSGPVMVDRGAVVQAFTRLEGPCYIGPGTHVLSARVKGSSIGPHCRLGGEVEASIVQGCTNKAHEGFLGHSYIGEWVNLAAGTQTSDLRNDYGNVGVTIDRRRLETGLLKVGAFIGDHTKTSIHSLFNTGSVCGPFGMMITAGSMLPRSLPAFCQVSRGQITGRTDLWQMFATARTMMSRRQVTWTDAHADFFLGLYERTADERREAFDDGAPRRPRRYAV